MNEVLDYLAEQMEEIYASYAAELARADALRIGFPPEAFEVE